MELQTASIFHTEDVQTAAEYIRKYRHTNPSLDWDSVPASGWTKLAEVLGVDINKWANGKSRRAIDYAAIFIHGEQKPTSLSKIVATRATKEDIQAKAESLRAEAQASVSNVATKLEETGAKLEAAATEVVQPLTVEQRVAKAKAEIAQQEADAEAKANNPHLKKAIDNLVNKSVPELQAEEQEEEAPAFSFEPLPDGDDEEEETFAPIAEEPTFEEIPSNEEEGHTVFTIDEPVEEQPAEELQPEQPEIKAEPAEKPARKSRAAAKPEKAVEAPKTEQKAEVTATTSDDEEESEADKLLKQLGAMLKGTAKKSDLDEGRVREIANEEAREVGAGLFETQIEFDKRVRKVENEVYKMTKTVEVKPFDMPAVNVGRVHFKFETILRAVAAGVNVFLVGPAGAGKTTACEKVAEALGLTFEFTSVCAQTSETKLLGFQNITTGEYVTTAFRRAYEFGGLFLLDEIDNGNPNVLAVLNAALANGQCSFPDKIVRRHPNFKMVAAGNTYGTGADRVYVGRNPLDGATLDRFVMIDFPYDEELEREISGNDKWVDFVQKVRKELKKERVIISPRASINGAKLLAAGINIEDVIDMTIRNGLPADMRGRVDVMAKK